MRTHEIVREKRQQAGMSQFDLAVAAGVTPQTINRLEHDRCDPRVGTLRAIARGLECPIADLLGDDIEKEH